MNTSPSSSSPPHSSIAFCLTAVTSFMEPVPTLGWVLTFLSWNALQTLSQPTDFNARLYGCGRETHCWRDPFNTLKTELMFPFPDRSGALWAVGAQFMTPSDGNVGRGWAEPARWETVPAAEFHPRCLHFLKNREGTEWLH